MKRVYSALFASLFLTACPPPEQPTPPQTAAIAPVPSSTPEAAPVQSEVPTGPPLSMTVIEHEIPLRQPSLPEEITTVRIVADFELEVTGNVDLHMISGVLTDSDQSEAGDLKLIYRDHMVGYADLSKLQDGQFAFKSRLLLEAGRHPFKIVVESTHDRGDTLQLELRSIATSLPELSTVFRWHRVSCGP